MDPDDPCCDPDHSQNLIIFSFYLFRHILKILSKSDLKTTKFVSFKVQVMLKVFALSFQVILNILKQLKITMVDLS